MNEKEGETYHDDSTLSSITTTATIIDSNLSCHGNLYGKNVGYLQLHRRHTHTYPLLILPYVSFEIQAITDE